MKSNQHKFSLFLVLGLAVGAFAPATFAQEPAQLGKHDTALESLRAGAVNESGLALAVTERESLVTAAAAAPILETLRATDLDLSNHELEVILVTVAVVLILVVVL